MDTLTFIAKLAEALGWPIAAIVLAAWLRKEIRALLPYVKRVKAGPLEAEFEREVRELKASTEAAPAEARKELPPPPSQPLLLQLAELHARSAILEAWVRVEAAARAALEKKSPATATVATRNPHRLAEQLGALGLLEEDQVSLFHELRNLRNEVAHVPEFSPSRESVVSYIEMASYLQSWLEDAASDA